MALNHPYTSGGGTIVQIIQHLRRSFPQIVDADTLKRLGMAPKNESYLINILRFIGIIDNEGKKTEKASKTFSLHEDQKFQAAFAGLVKAAYRGLFADHGEASWKLDNNSLITFFRQSDESSGIVGARQANTFRVLSAIAGHANGPDPKHRPASSQQPRVVRVNGKAPAGAPKKTEAPLVQQPSTAHPSGLSPFGLTVRVEVNLPADANQETYDKIFQSIRKNLINGK